MSRVIKVNLPVPVGNSFIQMKAGFTTRQKKTVLFWLPSTGNEISQYAQFLKFTYLGENCYLY